MKKKSIKYAGIWKRLIAYAVDLILLSIIYAVFGFFFNYILAIILLPLIGFWFYGGLLVASWLYFTLFESSSRCATPGKQLLHLKVVDLTGKRISFLRATARYLCRIIFPIGVITIPFSKKKQALYDMLAQTVVIKSK